jgi:hypothetical protein
LVAAEDLETELAGEGWRSRRSGVAEEDLPALWKRPCESDEAAVADGVLSQEQAD